MYIYIYIRAKCPLIARRGLSVSRDPVGLLLYIICRAVKIVIHIHIIMVYTRRDNNILCIGILYNIAVGLYIYRFFFIRGGVRVF